MFAVKLMFYCFYFHLRVFQYFVISVQFGRMNAIITGHIRRPSTGCTYRGASNGAVTLSECDSAVIHL